MIVFARTRHVYDSYTDFWRLVEASGFATGYVDEIDLSAAGTTYIFTPINGEVMPRLGEWQDRRCRIVWWNLERPEDETLPSSLAAVAGAVDAVWVSDRTYAARDPRLTYVRLAGHEGIATRSDERHHDVCHLAYIHGRRSHVVDGLLRRGVRIAPAAYGRVAQDRIVARSHLMLNLHQYDGMNILAPIRFAVAASYAIPIVSEPYADASAADLSVAQAPLAQIVTTVVRVLEDRAALRRQGEALFGRLCLETDFAREVIYAVSRL